MGAAPDTSSSIQTSHAKGVRHCRSRSCTGSAALLRVADYTADRDFHPALKTRCSVVLRVL